MSNRLRILFRSGLDNSTHTGKRALKALEALVMACQQIEAGKAPKRHWISEQEWIALGQPLFHESNSRLAPATGALGNPWSIGQYVVTTMHYYLVDVPSYPIADKLAATDRAAMAPVSPKALLTDLPTDAVTRARLLWKRLPDPIRKTSYLFITREHRQNAWRRSLTNPRRYGWAIRPVKPQKYQSVGPTFGGATGFNNGNGLTAGTDFASQYNNPYLQTAAEPATTFDLDGNEVPTPSAVPKSDPKPSRKISYAEIARIKAEQVAFQANLDKKLKKVKLTAQAPVPGTVQEEKARLKIGIWS